MISLIFSFLMTLNVFAVPDVIGVDNRLPVREDYRHPFNKIAHLISQTVVPYSDEYVQIRQAKCTGTLVAPDLILTAKHCLEGGKVGEKAAHKAVLSLNKVFSLAVSSTIKYISKQADIALLETEIPLHKNFGYLGVQFNASKNELIMTAGFPGDKEGMHYQVCRYFAHDVKNSSADEWNDQGISLSFSDCDALNGMSGSGVFQQNSETQEWKINSVLTGGDTIIESGLFYKKERKGTRNIPVKYYKDEIQKLILKSIEKHDPDRFNENLYQLEQTPGKRGRKVSAQKTRIYKIWQDGKEDRTILPSDIKLEYDGLRLKFQGIELATRFIGDLFKINFRELSRLNEPTIENWLQTLGKEKSDPFFLKEEPLSLTLYSLENPEKDLVLLPFREPVKIRKSLTKAEEKVSP